MSTSPGYQALRGAALAYRAADRDLRKRINSETKARLSPLWARTVSNRARTRQDKAVFTRARVLGGNPGRLVVADGRRPLTGGLTPADDWPLVDFGSAGAHGRRGQLPRRYPSGRVGYGAVQSWAPTAARLWLYIVLDTYARDPDTGAEVVAT